MRKNRWLVAELLCSIKLVKTRKALAAQIVATQTGRWLLSFILFPDIMAFPHGTARCWASRIRKKGREWTVLGLRKWEILQTWSITITRTILHLSQEWLRYKPCVLFLGVNVVHSKKTLAFKILKGVMKQMIHCNVVECNLLCLYACFLHLLTNVFVCCAEWRRLIRGSVAQRVWLWMLVLLQT